MKTGDIVFAGAFYTAAFVTLTLVGFAVGEVARAAWRVLGW